jgi:hypothetical protein
LNSAALQVLRGRFCHLCGLCLLLLLESCSFTLYSGTLNQLSCPSTSCQLSHLSSLVQHLSPSCRSALFQLSHFSTLVQGNSYLPAAALLLTSCQLSDFSTLVHQLSPSCHSALYQLSIVTFLYSLEQLTTSCRSAPNQLSVVPLFLHFCTLVLQLSVNCRSFFNQLTAFKLYSSPCPTCCP